MTYKELAETINQMPEELQNKEVIGYNTQKRDVAKILRFEFLDTAEVRENSVKVEKDRPTLFFYQL
jgi:hypothetical protein